MGTSFIQPGDVLEFTAPTGGVTKGVPVLIAGMPVIPLDTALVGVAFRGAFLGIHLLPKTTTETWTVGQPAFWDAASGKVSNDPTVGHLPIGAITAAATNTDTTGYVRLNGTSLGGRVFTRRKRFTIAEVNVANATLLPAIAGAKYRMVAASGISVGGAAAAVTTVDIIATLSSSTRKLVAFAQASLTRSTVLTDGVSGAAVLADGASYTPNDANTAVTVGKTGADVTTATHIDISFTYTIE